MWSNALTEPWKSLPDYEMYSDRLAWANSIDPDQMPKNVASDQGLYCLPHIQHFLNTYTGSKIE